MAADSLADGPLPPTPSPNSLPLLPFPLLQGTRLSAKREKALSLRREELLARSALLVEMARYSSSPECSLTVRCCLTVTVTVTVNVNAR